MKPLQRFLIPTIIMIVIALSGLYVYNQLKSPIQPANERIDQEFNKCEEPLVVPLVRLRWFIYCPDLDKVWYESWGRWDTPGRLHRKRLIKYDLNQKIS